MREEHDQIIDASRPLTRRGFALWGAAGLLVAGVSSLTLAEVAAREAEPGDDHGGHGADDPPGDDNGGRGADDGPGDDRGRRRRRRRRHG